MRAAESRASDISVVAVVAEVYPALGRSRSSFQSIGIANCFQLCLVYLSSFILWEV